MSTQLIPCAICAGTGTRTIYVKFGYDIGRCVRCGLVYVNPRPPTEAIQARYSADYFWNEYLPALGVVDGRYDLTRFDARYAPLLQLLEAAPGRRLLEVGSAAGFFLKAAERVGWGVAGIEPSEEGSRFARERLGLDVSRGNAESASLDAGAFDAAVMFDTIEHLLDPLKVVRSIAQSLVPEGLLVVGTPNFNALSRFVLGADWAVLSPLEHMYYFEERTLGRLIELAGFERPRFVRKHAAWTPQETLNFAYTHAPEGRRARMARSAVLAGGPLLARTLQTFGRQDILLCVARRARQRAQM